MAVEETLFGLNHLFSGVTLALFSVATLGWKEKNTHLAIEHLTYGGLAAYNFYFNFLKSLNPEAHITQESLFFKPLNRINKKALELSQSSNQIKKHVFSRCVFASLAVAATISRIAECVIGLIAMTFSCLTLGKFPRLNLLASSGLRFPLLFRDLFLSAINCIHPGSQKI